MSSRRLSQAIAEGDGISLLVEVAHVSEGPRLGASGAEGLVLRAGVSASEERAALPALAYGLLAVAWARPASLSPWDTVPDAGDPLHLAWVMAWAAIAALLKKQ